MFSVVIKNLILFVVLLENAFADILVNLPTGTIRGKESLSALNNTYYSFLKVPYASPPVGDLRFKAPIPPESWEGILDTTENTAICFQVSYDFDQETEDCLYLNIFTPKLPSEDDHAPLPVIFYIHGGGFVIGTCLDFICGPEFLIDYDVVVVTVNYRLGPFGFLSTGDSVIPGNNGLKDQHLAIKWTHDIIHLFGGDPNKITIWGQSAGAASVTYQLLNKNSEGLFRAGICDSGSFLSPWSFQRNPREIAFKTAGYIDDSFNNNNDSQALHDFLLSVSARELDNASYSVSLGENFRNYQISQGYFYAPVLEPENDGAFLTRKMYEDLEKGNFVRVPILIGINSEEAVEATSDLETFKNFVINYDEHLDALVPHDLNIKNPLELALVGELIKVLYTGAGQLQDNLAAAVKYFSDNSFTRSVIKHAQLQSKYTDVYFYQFSYDGAIGDINATIQGADKVAHSEELKYIWLTNYNGYDNSNLNLYSEGDLKTHNQLLKIWTDFAKTLNPTPERSDLLNNIEWPKVSDGTKKDLLYVNIDDSLEIRNHPKAFSFKGWNAVYDIFGRCDFYTY